MRKSFLGRPCSRCTNVIAGSQTDVEIDGRPYHAHCAVGVYAARARRVEPAQPVSVPIWYGRGPLPVDQADGAAGDVVIGRQRDTGYAPERWTFDAEVARCFEDMLARSVPGLDAMRRVVFEVGERFVRPQTTIVDLGASRGAALVPFVERFAATCRFVAVERSRPMVEELMRTFAGKPVRIWSMDLRDAYPAPADGRVSLTLAVLTLQFVPVTERPRLLRDVYRSTCPGGALIVVEKVLAADARVDEMLVDVYHARKVANGYTRAEVEAKRRSLEGVLVPLSAPWNEELLREAGFESVECVWRELNFAAWIAARQE